MILEMVIGLCMQAISVALLRINLGRSWLQRPTVIMVIMSVFYQSVSAILLTVPSIEMWDQYRIGISAGYAAEAELILSAAILALVISYLAVAGKVSLPTWSPTQEVEARKILDWRLLAFACVPLAIYTYNGRGYNGGITQNAATPLATELSSTFFVMLITLATFAFLWRHGNRWFVAAIMIQSTLLAAAGQRGPVIMSAVALLALLAHLGRSPSRKQILTAAALMMAAFIAITGIRAQSGRTLFRQDSGIAARLEALGSGFASLGRPSAAGAGPGVVSQLAQRIDGNAFAAGVLQGSETGQHPLGFTALAESVLIVIPHVLWPAKLQHQTGLNPSRTEIDAFGLQRVNFLPTLPGLYIGFLGPYALIPLIACIGFLFGFLERWMFRRSTLSRLVFYSGALYAMSAYEQGFPGIITTLRTALILAGAAKIITLVIQPGQRTRAERKEKKVAFASEESII